MPRMDGLELPPPPAQDLPVIFLTSKDEEIDELMGPNAAPMIISASLLSTSVAGTRARRAAEPRRDTTAGGWQRCRQEGSPDARSWPHLSAMNAPGTASRCA